MSDATKELIDALRTIATMKDQAYYKVQPNEAMRDAALIAEGAIAKAEAEFALPQADADGWIPWNGERAHPKGLPENVQVRVRLRNGCLVDGRVSGNFEWFHFEEPGDIIAYRIVTT